MTFPLPTIHESNGADSEPMIIAKRRRYYGILSTRTADACLDWVIFPALLFVQFGATMYCQSQQGVLRLNWVSVLATVGIFCVVAGIYRRVLRQHPMDSLPLLLLPEIFTNVLLAMVMFGNLESAFEALVVLVFVLLLVGGTAAVHAVILAKNSIPGDYRPLHDDDEDCCESEEEWIC